MVGVTFVGALDHLTFLHLKCAYYVFGRHPILGCRGPPINDVYVTLTLALGFSDQSRYGRAMARDYRMQEIYEYAVAYKIVRRYA
jgi:hypothetical protein